MAKKLYFGEMNLYCAGVFDGMVYFYEDGLMLRYVDQKTRFLGTAQPPVPGDFMVLPFDALHKKCAELSGADWQGETVTLPCGDTYSRHTAITGEAKGQTRTAQVWAQRKADPAVDVITLDGQIIAFLQAHRYGLEIAVVSGYEALTPLCQYTDPSAKLSQPDYGIDILGVMTAAMRDGVRLAQRVFLPYGAESGARFPTILVRSCYTKERMQYKLSKYVNKG